ncbi:MAG: hypothetical protein HY392_00705, partial [Candidatus Diapherotrites archaeon]|nr:hypothetical protein [Candidatus Diapherotrites archaeon]
MMQYTETVKILDISLGDYDGDAIFNPVNKKINQTIFIPPFPFFRQKTAKREQKLYCFLPNIKTFKTVEKGKIIKVQLSLVDFSATKINKPVKKLEQTKRQDAGTNESLIFGEIIEMIGHPKFPNYKEIIVDCGIFVRTSVQNSQNFKK